MRRSVDEDISRASHRTEVVALTGFEPVYPP